MSKRRVFDIDFDDTSVEPPKPAETRRGPMASAIAENADALSERQAAEAAIRAENDRLAHEYVALKKDGQIVGKIALDEIKVTKLTRDRAAGADPELQELMTSIKAVGLSNPIHVEETEAGFELIQGYRRLSAFRALHEETGDQTYARIPATLQARGAALDQLYRRMVDENLVRRDISFAEMAQLAMAYAKQTATVIGETPDSIDILYASAGRQKRSYIRNFAHLLRAIGGDLKFPEVLPRALGLHLLKLLDRDPRLIAQVKAVLAAQPNRDADAELAILRSVVANPKTGAKPKKQAASKSVVKTTLKLNRPEGVAKCTALDGRIEVQLEQDFSAIDRRKLEAALRSFLDQLKD